MSRASKPSLPFGIHLPRAWIPKGGGSGRRSAALAALAALAVVATVLAIANLRAGGVGASSAWASSKASKHPITARIVTDTQTVGRYLPRRIHVRLGEAIRFVNRSIDAHTVTADNGSFNSGYIAVGKSWTFVPTRVGRFVYHCTYHPVMGGVIVVSP